MGPRRVAGLVGEPGCCVTDPWCLQRPGEVLDLLGRLFRDRRRVVWSWCGLGGHQATCPSLRRGVEVDTEGGVVVGQVPQQLVGRDDWSGPGSLAAAAVR